MLKEIRIPIFDLIICLTDTMDLINPAITNHHKKVAYIALSIAEELGLSLEEQNDIFIASILHDIGALSLKEKLEALRFEDNNLNKHGQIGYLLLKNFHPFNKAAKLVQFHHINWNYGKEIYYNNIEIPLNSHIIHLADRISILINKEENILNQVNNICKIIKENSGSMFHPDFVNSFFNLSEKAHFWLDIVSPLIDNALLSKTKLTAVMLNIEDLLDLTKIFSHIIDFRSRFTATHSCGVAAVSKILAHLLKFSDIECKMAEIAGYLHDLGKLAVPSEILEKPDRLTEEEFNIIKSHTFYTYRSLERIKDLEIINIWASYHHERLDGKGYPFGLKGNNLILGSRILCVADVFTAIMEDRPYRKGMTKENALKTLDEMADNFYLDKDIVNILKSNFEEINIARINSQNLSFNEYSSFFNNEILAK